MWVFVFYFSKFEMKNIFRISIFVSTVIQYEIWIVCFTRFVIFSWIIRTSRYWKIPWCDASASSLRSNEENNYSYEQRKEIN